MHAISVKTLGGEGWDWNGSYDRPTFQPSIKVGGKQAIHEKGRWTGEYRRGPDGLPLDLCCHSFITDGAIQFLGDCTHGLAGQTIPIPDLPDFLSDEDGE